MYIDLIINNEARQMHLGYMRGVHTIPNDKTYYQYLYKDAVPNIVNYGTSFKQILGNDRPDTIKDANGNLFATKKIIQSNDFLYSTIKIPSYTAPSGINIFPVVNSNITEITQYINLYYELEINRALGGKLNCYPDNLSIYTESNSAPYCRDFMLFATDEIINDIRTIIVLYDNKYEINNYDSGLCYGESNNKLTIEPMLAINWSRTNYSFEYNTITDARILQPYTLFYSGTATQAGGRRRKRIASDTPTENYANFDYGNLVELNDYTKKFYCYHFTTEQFRGLDMWITNRGCIQNNKIQKFLSDKDNPTPPTPNVPDIPLPPPENPTDPDNPDNPDNLNPEPSDPIKKPIPTPSPTFTAKLITAYNLSASSLNALSDEIWSSNFTDNIVKLFQNPMDCLISLSEYPIHIPSSEIKNIKLGNVELTTVGNVIENPFVTIDLGTAILAEKYKSYLDYMNTSIQIYLPFIGFEQLSIDYMNSQLQLQYNVDILSGNCVAILYAISYNSNLQSVVGQWNGNMAYSIPLSGRDYSNMASSLWNTAMSAGSVIASSRIPTMAGSGFSKGTPGGFGLPSLGSVSDLGNNIINTIEAANATTSGGHLSANAGHLGSLQPYLIISRPVQKINANYYNSYGRILDAYTPFSALSGYTKVKSVNLTIPSATEEEIKMIEDLLLKGVIF